MKRLGNNGNDFKRGYALAKASCWVADYDRTLLVR